MAQTPIVEIDSQTIFEDAFDDEVIGLSTGDWRFDIDGSSQTTNTGPGTNNTLSYMHTETSSLGDIPTAEMNGAANFADVPDEISRTLHLRLCIQGLFGDGMEGMQIQHRVLETDAWTEAAFFHGWAYGNNYSEDDTITDENGVDQICAADGGWIDFEATIPDSALQVRVQPRYIDGGGGAHRHDVGLRSFFWEWPDFVVTTPTAPLQLEATEIDKTVVVLEWVAPLSDGGFPITGYEYRIGSAAWVATGTSALIHRLTGLTPGTAYDIQVRAITSQGNGLPSVVLHVTTLEVAAPSIPRYFNVSLTGETTVYLEWVRPTDDGGGPITKYELCVILEDGTQTPFEPTDGPETHWYIRGLAIGHRYGFRVRAVNSAGRGPQSGLIYATPLRNPVRRVPAGQRIPLLGADQQGHTITRQSLIVRLDDQTCRVRVWWQPWDNAWYGALEVPANTPLAEGIRLATDSGLLDRISTAPLRGNIVCRALSAANVTLEPGREAWRNPTHELRWEPTV